MKKLLLVISMLSVSAVVTAAPDEAKKGDFVKGVKAWQSTCNRCHNMRDPSEFNDPDWAYILRHMRIRAGLTGQDERDILAYLQQSNNR